MNVQTHAGHPVLNGAPCAAAQGTEEWFKARLGCVTGSRLNDMLARTKSGWGAARERYRVQLVLERLLGENKEDSFTSEAMRFGIETEPFARDAYAKRCSTPVQQVGFIPHSTIPHAGASPDGLVGEKGVIEIKCPDSHTHLNTLLKQEVPSKYLNQCHWQLAVTGREWLDWISFDPRWPDPMQMVIVRLERDPQFIYELESDVIQFLAEVADTCRELQEKFLA